MATVGPFPILTFVLLSGLVVGCSGLRDELARAEKSYADARYEDAEAWLDAVSPSVAEMPAELRAKFYYLSGMTQFRLGSSKRARHELALCRAQLALAPTALTGALRENLNRTLRTVESP